MVHTIDVESEHDVPRDFTGRMRQSVDGVLVCSAWYRDGKLEDPAPSTPAYVRYRRNGQPKQERHYRLGRLHDPSPGAPAVRGFFANGTTRYVEHFRYGRRHDSGNRAAIVKWRLDGSIRAVRHYFEGERIERITGDDRAGDHNRVLVGNG